MPDLKLYILGFPHEFRGNHWKRDIEESAVSLGWDVVHEAAQAADPEEVLRQAKDADLFLWLRTHNNDPHGDAYTMLRRIEDTGTPTVGMHMDLYWNIPQREPLVNVQQNPWWSCQRVYTADGGHAEEFAERGVNHFWMPPGFGDKHFGLVELPKRNRFKKRYVFVGSNSRGVHGEHRTEMLKWATKTYAGGFQRYGAHNKIYGVELSQLYASARIVIGDSAPSDYYWSDRIPTTMGRGGVLAYPRTVGLEENGYNDGNMVLFDRFEFDELKEKIDSLSNDDIANMREAALTVTEERHMWRHRLLQIKEEVLG
ncbi:glycosyltransferase [Streptomyces phage Dryad]|nr:glycosyltransferase [Streptomyces phage Dryad]